MTGVQTCALPIYPLLDSLAFAAVLHLGTLAAVLVAMRREVTRLLSVALRFAFTLGRERGDAADERLIVAIILGTLPAAIVGALAADLFDSVLRSPGIVAAAVLAGALLLELSERLTLAGLASNANTFLIGPNSWVQQVQAGCVGAQ